MANTESTFGDRLLRGQQLHSIIASFDPAFAPADEDLEPAEFLTFLEELDTLNEAVVDSTSALLNQTPMKYCPARFREMYRRR